MTCSKNNISLWRKAFAFWVFIFLFNSQGFIQTAHAQLGSCVQNTTGVTGSNSTPVPIMQNFQINVASYVGDELPVGSVIYHGEFRETAGMRGPNGITFDCSWRFGSRERVSHLAVLTPSPFGPPVSIGGRLVFPTNVAGIGVSICEYYCDGGVNYSTTPTQKILEAYGDRYDIYHFTTNNTLVIELIKMDSIISGSQVDAGSFPGIRTYIEPLPGETISGLPKDIAIVNFSGAINFTTSTCATPDVNVAMGSHGIDSGTFSGIGSATRWVDASIILQRCPTFSGRFSGFVNYVVGNGQIEDPYSSSPPTLLTVSLTPISNTSGDGKIEVDAVGSTGAAARGVAIQLGYATDIGHDPRLPIPSDFVIWTPGARWDIQPNNDGRSDMKIPISARYIQTENTVTAGPANARVTFNIDYK